MKTIFAATPPITRDGAGARSLYYNIGNKLFERGIVFYNGTRHPPAHIGFETPCETTPGQGLTCGFGEPVFGNSFSRKAQNFFVFMITHSGFLLPGAFELFLFQHFG
jgi:hypothetical protein